MKKDEKVKEKSFSATILLLLFFIIIVLAAGLAYAKFVTSKNGTATAQVAEFRFALKNINGDSTATAQSGTIQFPITRTDDNTKIAEGKLAPETYGRFDMIIDGTGSKVAYRYDIDVTVTNCPYNLKFYEDKEHEHEISTTRVPANPQPEDNKTATFRISKYVPLNRVNEEHKEIVYWDWQYETGNITNEINANDLLDSADMEKTVTMNIVATGTQVTEQPAGVPEVGTQLQTISIVKLDVSQVDNTTATLDLGTQAEVVLSYTQTPTNLEDLVISSSDSSVATATVDLTNNKVVVNALKKGTATITLRGEHSWNITKTIAVTVQGTYINELSLSSDNSTVSVAPSGTGSVTINDFANLYQVEPFTITSSDSSIATASYDNNGTITISGVAVGTATITLTGSLSNTTITIPVSVTLILGTTINYTTTLNGQTLNNWKLFYNDTENDKIYLIYGDYLPNSYLKDSNGNSIISNLSFSNNYAVYVPTGSGNSRVTLINAMTTRANWSSLLKGSINGGEEFDFSSTDYAGTYDAMGSPTLDLFVQSWNKKYPNNETYSTNQIYTAKRTGMSDTIGWGYYVSRTNNPPTGSEYSANMAGSEGYKSTSNADLLYYPHPDTGSWNNTDGYWLASPSANSKARAMTILYGGIVSYNQFFDTAFAFRPVVCLPASVLE